MDYHNKARLEYDAVLHLQNGKYTLLAKQTMKKQTATKPILALGLTPALQKILFFDKFTPGDVNRAVRVETHAGGKASNLAMALAVLGDKAYVGGFNGGTAGRLAAADVTARGAIPAFTKINAETRTCSSIVDLAKGSVTELVQEFPAVTDDDLARFTRKMLALLPKCAGMTISGTLPKVFPQDSYIPFGTKATKLGIPWLIDSHKAPLLSALPCHPTVAKLNRFELGQTFGEPVATEKDCIRLLGKITERGAEWALMTDGAAPAILFSPDGGLWKLTPEKLNKVASPIGSGDCTAAGIIHGLVHGMTVPDSVAYGLACGTANAKSYVPADFVRPPVA